MKTELALHNRTLILHRFPKRTNETLQAWDAGDEYLINHVEELALESRQNILILNDHFGTLSCWFSSTHKITMMSDSFISHQATLANLKENQGNEITLLSTYDVIPKDVDLVLIQLPKSNRHLMWQLYQLRQSLPSHIPIIAVNKAKEIHSSTLKLFEKYLGTTTTSLAWKKHRLIFAYPNASPAVEVIPFTSWQIEDHNIQLDNLPNVYSGESLDLGARFMLQHLPTGLGNKRVIDLGCGNGVLSIKLAQINPDIKLTCVDESFMSIASAQRNLDNNVSSGIKANCITNNCLDGFEAQSAEFIVCNPPFHQQQAITDHIAWQMFCDAKHVLCNGGQLLVIGNRHLGYDGKLARLFGKSNIKQVAANKKFVILQATK